MRPKVGKAPRLQKFQWHSLAGPVFSVFVLFYLGFHTLNGERGLYALFKEQRKLAVLQGELEAVQAERAALEHKVKLLSSDSLDLDLLDEQARSMLGMAADKEVVVFRAR